MDAATKPTSIEEHLRAALSAADNDEARYHLRESIQKCYVDD